jgi:hypothetical protein
LVCYEQKVPLGFKNNFPLIEVGYSKITEAQCALSRNIVWSLSGFLEAFLEDFWAESGMVGNCMMSDTQWNHQALQIPSPNLGKLT